MVENKKVGIAIADAYVKNEQDISDYEFPDSGYVKLNLTKSDLAVLEAAPSEPDLLSKSSTSLAMIRNQNVQIRLLATVAVLLSFGFLCLLLNCFVWHAMRNAEMKQILLGIFAFIVGISTGDWYRLHGEKLSRTLKALLNVSNVLNSLDTFAFDLFGICKRFKLNRKYFFSLEDLKINEKIPRTPETSPPLSPPKRERNETKSLPPTRC